MNNYPKFNELSSTIQEQLLFKIEQNGLEPTNDVLEKMINDYFIEINTFTVNDITTSPLVSTGVGGTTAVSTEKVISLVAEEFSENILTDLLQVADYVGEDLVIINYNIMCSPLCLGAQNNIYSTSGKNKKYRYLEDYTKRTQGWENGHALFHRYCKHWVTIYYEGLSDPPEKEIPEKITQELYDDQQRLQYLNKNRANWLDKSKRTKALGIDNSYEYGKYKEWQQRYTPARVEFDKKYAKATKELNKLNPPEDFTGIEEILQRRLDLVGELPNTTEDLGKLADEIQKELNNVK